MNKEIETIAKHAKTSFVGRVNDLTFTNRDEMNRYIGKCISEGIEITNYSYQQETRYQAEPEEVFQKPKWSEYVKQINAKVPNPYTDVMGYMVPYVKEDIDLTGEPMKKIVDDTNIKLTKRMEFMENYVFSEIRTGKYSDAEVEEWVSELISKLGYKADWCHKRVSELNSFVLSASNNPIFKTNTNIQAIKTFAAIYDAVYSWCIAMIDICNDNLKDL